MSAPLPAPNVMQVREPARPVQSAVNSSPAGNTATPWAPSASITQPFSCATACTLAMNSWCSRCALLTSATVGPAIRASVAISPGWFMPSSITASRCVASSRSSVSGRPISLFRLPWVASVACGCQARRTAAIICVTVVLPLLPATAISGNWKRARQPAAS